MCRWVSFEILYSTPHFKTNTAVCNLYGGRRISKNKLLMLELFQWELCIRSWLQCSKVLNSFLVKSNDPSGKIASLLIDPFTSSFRYAAAAAMPMPNCFAMTFITRRCSGPFRLVALRFYDLPVAWGWVSDERGISKARIIVSLIYVSTLYP